MKRLLLSTISLLAIITLSCKKESNPVTPTVGPLTGRWMGTIGYYTSDYSLYLTLNQVGNDSLTGQMIIGFANPDTVLIYSALYFSNDSLNFNINHSRGFCSYRTMYGKFFSTDSISGNWSYRCTNDPQMTSLWFVHRIQ